MFLRNIVFMSILAYLMMTNVPPGNWLRAIYSIPQLVGRSFENEIVIPKTHLTVSRRHLRIWSNGDAILARDLDSTGGTRLNGVLLTPNCDTQVVFGDRLALADVELIVVSPDAEILQHAFTEIDTSSETASSIILAGTEKGASLDARRLRQLSPAELQISFWVSRGLTSCKEIAAQLFRSPHTIRTQMNSIYRKLHVHSREELLAWLKRHELSWAMKPRQNTDSIHDEECAAAADFDAEELGAIDG
ncbi:MAG: Adenylate cyclase, class 3 [Schlesneria sp.]|nr:Adenylate cyclase, class 3 [Schlesneria sp.]